MPKYLKDEVDETFADENVASTLDINEELTESFDDKCDNNEEVVGKTKIEIKKENTRDIKDDETIKDARDEVVLRKEYVSKPKDKNVNLRVKEEVIGESLDETEIVNVENM